MGTQRRFGVLLLVIAVFGWFAVVKPQINRFGGLALKNKVSAVELKSRQKRLSDIEFIKSRGSEVTKHLEALYLALPKGGQIPEALVMIEALGNTAGVVFSEASVGSPTGSEVPVSISFSGTLGAVSNFLDQVNANIRMATVKNQSLRADEGGVLTVSMQLGLYYQGGE